LLTLWHKKQEANTLANFRVTFKRKHYDCNYNLERECS